MATYKVVMTVKRDLVWYVDAESEDDVREFIDADAEWLPGDVPGLIDHVDDESLDWYDVMEVGGVEAKFEIYDLELFELE